MKSTLETRVRITVAALAATAVGYFLVLPGSPAESLNRARQSFFFLVTPDQLSLFSLGILPYLLAAAVVLLLSGVIGDLRRMRDGMVEERSSFDRLIVWTGLIMGGVAALQNAVALETVAVPDGPRPSFVASLALSALGGLALLIAMAWIITGAGIGNGVALIALVTLFLVKVPAGVHFQARAVPRDPVFGYFPLLLVGAPLAALVVACLGFLRARQDLVLVPVEGSLHREHRTLPMRLNLVGVVPALAAQALVSIPDVVRRYLRGPEVWHIQEISLFRWAAFAVLTVVLCYIVTWIGFDARRVEPVLQRFGYRIDGVPRGQSTEQYLSRMIEKRIPLSAAILIAITLVPEVLAATTEIQLPLAGFSGLAVLAGCAIVLDTTRHARGLREVEPPDPPADMVVAEAIEDEAPPGETVDEVASGLPDEPAPEAWLEVFEADTELEASLAQAALADHGIRGVILSNRAIPLVGTLAYWEWTVPTCPSLVIHRRLGGGRVVLRVHERDAPRARELVAGLSSPSPPPGDPGGPVSGGA